MAPDNLKNDKKRIKVIVAGSRTVKEKLLIHLILDEIMPLPDSYELIEGECEGPDIIARDWALSRGYTVHKRPADWKKHGKAAGFIRNSEMADEGDYLVAFWDGKSKGTKNMIEQMEKRKKPYRIIDMSNIEL